MNSGLCGLRRTLSPFELVPPLSVWQIRPRPTPSGWGNPGAPGPSRPWSPPRPPFRSRIAAMVHAVGARGPSLLPWPSLRVLAFPHLPSAPQRRRASAWPPRIQRSGCFTTNAVKPPPLPGAEYRATKKDPTPFVAGFSSAE